MSNKNFKVKITAEAGLNLPAESTNTVPVVNGSKDLVSSSVTTTELNRLSGATADLADTEQAVADLNTLSGVAANATNLGTFTGATIPDSSTIKAALQSLQTSLEGIPSPIYYAGTWDAAANIPALDNTDTGVQGALYYVTVAGTVDFGAGNMEFAVDDRVVNNGTTWDKWDNTDSVQSVNSQTGAVVLDTDDINEGTTNLYYTDERAQDSVGTILTDSSSIDFTYTDDTPSITAVVLPAGVDHDQLANFVANEHVDHTTVDITTAADSGLSGGGDISASRTLVVDINGTTALAATPANADELLLWDASASVRRKVTVAELLSGVAVGSAGDIPETSFAAANNQATAANVTGLAFANGVVRSFEAIVSVEIDATSDLFEIYKLYGIQRGADWAMSIESTGDASGITFSITTAGQVQYTSTDVAGFSTGIFKFRAETTSI